MTDTDAGVRRQFELEAGLLINSEHPNIPPGYQLFEERARLYLVMEFIRGRDLEDLLNESLMQQRRPLDEAQVLRWAIEVCGALEVMHDREVPIIHRDIKPANIKITPENKPIVIDFGLAKLQTGGPTRTAAQGVSPGFAPPEQYMARGRTDARTDIYGLGATLYACLTGKDPPEAPARLLAQTGASGQALVSPRKFAKDVEGSDATDRAVVKALELSPGSRYQSARAFRDDLTIALRRLTGAPAPALVAEAVPAIAVVMCQHCGQQTRADLPRCQHCGVPLRTSGSGINGAKRSVVRPLESGKVAAAPPPRPTPASPPPKASPLHALPSTGKQPARPAGTGKQPIAPYSSGKQPVVPAASGKQSVIVPPAAGRGPSPVAESERT
ncbi:MAG TPA: serine/threonine-protein kinase, partial [Ktedonobacterales bacterium]|nr:serine/threonine-protein kinase [Ktedonobacterales bacterium]